MPRRRLPLKRLEEREERGKENIRNPQRSNTLCDTMTTERERERERERESRANDSKLLKGVFKFDARAMNALLS